MIVRPREKARARPAGSADGHRSENLTLRLRDGRTLGYAEYGERGRRAGPGVSRQPRRAAASARRAWAGARARHPHHRARSARTGPVHRAAGARDRRLAGRCVRAGRRARDRPLRGGRHLGWRALRRCLCLAPARARQLRRNHQRGGAWGGAGARALSARSWSRPVKSRPGHALADARDHGSGRGAVPPPAPAHLRVGACAGGARGPGGARPRRGRGHPEREPARGIPQWRAGRGGRIAAADAAPGAFVWRKSRCRCGCGMARPMASSRSPWAATWLEAFRTVAPNSFPAVATMSRSTGSGPSSTP